MQVECSSHDGAGSQCWQSLAATLWLSVLVPLPALGDRVAWEGGITGVYQAADSDRVDAEATASADLFATVSTGSGEWLIYIEASTTPGERGVSALYPTANADAGSVIGRNGDGGIQVSELNYTFRLDDRRTLMLGLIDPSAWLDRGRIANDENLHFLNGSFVNNATIEFPDYTLGGVFRWLGDGTRPEIVAVLASSDGLADLPDRSYQQLLDLTAGERGAFAGAGASWLRRNMALRLGAWLRTDDHRAETQGSDMNYGVYGVLGWQGTVHSVNTRIGIANDRVSVATGFAAAAYERRASLGLFGVGVARTFLAERFRRSQLADTTEAEMFFRIPLGASQMHLTPSIQYVQNPGFNESGSVPPSSAIVAGVRIRWAF